MANLFKTMTEGISNTFAAIFKRKTPHPSDPDGQKERNNKGKYAPISKLFWIAMALLAILLVLSIIVLAARINNFTSADERAVSLKSDSITELDVFSMEYKNDTGDIVIKGEDGEKLLAPGASVDYTIRIRNTDKVALNYDLAPQIELLSQYELPIEVRLIGPDDEYIVGDAKTWVPLDEMNNVHEAHTLLPGDSVEYIFQWQWPFDSEDDKYDTWLGDNAIEENIGLEMNFSIHAEANLDAAINGGFAGQHTDDVTFILIFLIILATAIALLVLSLLNRKPVPVVVVPAPMPMPEPEPEIMPEPVPEPEPVIEEIPLPPLRIKVATGKMFIINLDALQAHFESGETVTLTALKAKGLIAQNATQYKLLARGGLALNKSLIIEAQAVSAQAKAYVLQAGGEVRITTK